MPFPSPGDLPNPGIKPGLPSLQADFLLSKPPKSNRLKLQTILKLMILRNIYIQTLYMTHAEKDEKEEMNKCKIKN